MGGLGVYNYRNNAVCKGSFVSLDKEYYFINYKDNYSLYRMNVNNSISKIFNEKIKNLTAHKKWIYFTDHVGSAIFRITPDGKNKEIVYKSDIYGEEDINSIEYCYDDSIMNISNITIKDEWIYFSEYVGESLKKVRTDGRDVVILQRCLSSNINIVDEYIYFLNEFDGRIHRIVDELNHNENCNKIAHLAWEVPDMIQLNITNNYAYFIQPKRNEHAMFNLKRGKIYRMNIENNHLKMLYDDAIAMDFGEKYIFFVNALDSYSLYRMDFDGSGAVRISKAINIMKIKVIGQYVFFITEDNSFYKLNIFDGNEYKIV